MACKLLHGFFQSSATARFQLIRPTGYILKRDFGIFSRFFNKDKAEDEGLVMVSVSSTRVSASKTRLGLSPRRAQKLNQNSNIKELERINKELEKLRADMNARGSGKISEELGKRIIGLMPDIAAVMEKITKSLGKEDSPGPASASGNHGANKKSGGEKQQEQHKQSGSTDKQSGSTDKQSF